MGESFNTTLQQQYQQIYDTVYDANDEEKITFAYSAKGVLYAIISNSSDTDTRERIVFDRESKNGKCALFVRYKDVLDDSGVNVRQRKS